LTATRGGIVPNPLLKIARDAHADAVKIGTEFGLSTLSGNRIGIRASPREIKFEGLIG
jgi:phage terminase small subunit